MTNAFRQQDVLRSLWERQQILGNVKFMKQDALKENSIHLIFIGNLIAFKGLMHFRTEARSNVLPRNKI